MWELPGLEPVERDLGPAVATVWALYEGNFKDACVMDWTQEQATMERSERLQVISLSHQRWCADDHLVHAGREREHIVDRYTTLDPTIIAACMVWNIVSGGSGNGAMAQARRPPRGPQPGDLQNPYRPRGLGARSLRGLPRWRRTGATVGSALNWGAAHLPATLAGGAALLGNALIRRGVEPGVNLLSPRLGAVIDTSVEYPPIDLP